MVPDVSLVSHEIHPVPALACLGSATVFLLMVETSKSAGWKVLWLDSPNKLLVKPSSQLAIGGVLIADRCCGIWSLQPHSTVSTTILCP